MTKESLPQRFDDFELELNCIESLIDLLYSTPRDHPYRSKYLEELHTHRLNMREKYNPVREQILKAIT